MLLESIRTDPRTLSNNGHKPGSASKSGEPDNKADTEKSIAPGEQAGGLTSKSRNHRRRRNHRRPASQSRPPSSSSGERSGITGNTDWRISDFQIAPAEGKTRFHDLGLPAEVMHGISDLGFEYCTPIQTATLPETLSGSDITGKAQTGTGKTAAFLITVLTQLQRNPSSANRRHGTPRALIMVPTRELALQVEKEANLLGKYCQLSIVAVFGGMDYVKQRQKLAENAVDIVVATPGRLLDFNRHADIHLDEVEILVIDEADEMLDMGFMPDMRQIVASTPPKSRRQTMLFGATLTRPVVRLASQWTRNPVTVEIDPGQVAVDTVDQVLYLLRTSERFAVLYNIITQQNLTRILVFCNRRDQTRRLAEQLTAHGIGCAVLSGEVAQKKRIRTLDDFRSGNIRVLVATDVAGRGIHVDGISHVFNYNLPMDPEDYVHRIGRTGRAGATGKSIGFATENDSYQIPAIEDYLSEPLRCVYPDDALLTPVPPAAAGDSTQPHPRLLRGDGARRRNGGGKP